MIYKDSINSLLNDGLIKKCPTDYKVIKNLINRAYHDINTAKRNIEDDTDCTYNYAYNALLHSGLALMFSKGFRPDIKNKHLTIVRFTKIMLGSRFNKLINDYDFMRRKRHQFIYEPDIPCSTKEAGDSIITAEKFVDLISNLTKEKSPREELDF